MIRDRERLLWVTLPAVTAVTAVLLTCGSMGYMCSRAEIRQQRIAREQAEAAHDAVAARLEALTLGPQPAELPPDLDAQRIAELEQALKALQQGEAEHKKKNRRERERLEASNRKLKADLKTATRELQAEQRVSRRAAEAARALAEPSPPASPAAVDAPPAAPARQLAESPRVIPPVSAEAPAPLPCGGVERLPYRIQAAERSHMLLDDRLRLRVDGGSKGLTLSLAGLAGHALDELPQHFSWTCEGEPYIVSVCRADADPLEVSGEIWSAGDRWRDPCKRSAARAAPRE